MNASSVNFSCYSSQTHAELNLAKADASLRQKEGELARLRAEHQALTLELTTVKQGLTTSTERAEKLHGEGQVGIQMNTRYMLYSSIN